MSTPVLEQLTNYDGINLYMDVVYDLMTEEDHERQDELDPEGVSLFVIQGSVYRYAPERSEWIVEEI